MRISDWSSDVCSSDLGGRAVHPLVALLPLLVVGLGNLALTMLIPRLAAGEEVSMSLPGLTDPVAAKVAQVAALWAVEGALLLGKIGRASCWESVRQYV